MVTQQGYRDGGWQEKGFWYQFMVYAIAYVGVFAGTGFLVWAALTATSG
jgi:hypothetical protein